MNEIDLKHENVKFGLVAIQESVPHSAISWNLGFQELEDVAILRQWATHHYYDKLT